MSAMLLHFEKPHHVSKATFLQLHVRNARVLGTPLPKPIERELRALVIANLQKSAEKLDW